MAPRLKMFTPDQEKDLPVEVEHIEETRITTVTVKRCTEVIKDTWQSDDAGRSMSEPWTGVTEFKIKEPPKPAGGTGSSSSAAPLRVSKTIKRIAQKEEPLQYHKE